ncbi:hypothetical protein D1872_342990 [compost metagenome]
MDAKGIWRRLLILVWNLKADPGSLLQRALNIQTLAELLHQSAVNIYKADAAAAGGPVRMGQKLAQIILVHSVAVVDD